MGRIHQFRGKRANGGGWVYGSLVIGGAPEFGCHIVTDDDLEAWVDVDPATVGEHTGLVDLGGQPVFEGDYIALEIERHDGVYEHVLTRAVFFENGEFLFDRALHMRVCVSDGILHGRVVGNAADNPEFTAVWKMADGEWEEETDTSDY